MRNVQIPDDVYQEASKLAEQDHVSVEKVIAALVSQGIGEWSRLKDRAARGSVTKLKAVLARVSDTMPEPVDQI